MTKCKAVWLVLFACGCESPSSQGIDTVIDLATLSRRHDADPAKFAADVGGKKLLFLLKVDEIIPRSDGSVFLVEKPASKPDFMVIGVKNAAGVKVGSTVQVRAEFMDYSLNEIVFRNGEVIGK